MGVKDRYETFHHVEYTHRGDRGGGLSVQPLHHRPVPARQGDRPHRRGGRAREAARGRSQRRDGRDQPQRPDGRRAARRGRDRAQSSRRPGSTAIRKLQARESLQRRARAPRREVRRDAASPIGKQEIDEVVSKWTGVPLTSVNEDEGGKLLRMEDELHRRVISQEKAISALSRAIRRSRAGLKNPHAAGRQLHLPGPDRRRQDRAGARAREFPVRQRPRADSLRHVRVHGEALGLEADRLAARIRRPRRGRSAHREDQAQSRTRSCCSTRSRRRTRICSTSCCRCSRTAT